ncbi:Catabolite control protein A [Streptomyces badius]
MGPVSAPTLYDVAERSGVSIATVSRVYRNPDSGRAQTREKVMEAARELGYVPSGSARGWPAGRRACSGVLPRLRGP